MWAMGMVKGAMEEAEDRGFWASGETACTCHVSNHYLLGQAEAGADRTGGPCSICGSTDADQFDIDPIIDTIVNTIRFYWRPALNDLWRDSESDNGWALVRTRSTSELAREILDGEVDEDLIDLVVGSLAEDKEWYSPSDLWLEDDELISYSWAEYRKWVDTQPEGADLTASVAPPSVHWSEPADGIEPGEMLRRLADVIVEVGLLRHERNIHEWYRAIHLLPHEEVDAKRLGTAPPAFAEDNRMSAASVPMYYGAAEKGTALDEIGTVPTGKTTAVGRWRTSRPPLVIDFTRIPEPPSFFDIEHAWMRGGVRALEQFADEIRQPLVKDGGPHTSYRPTQAMTSQLRSAVPGLEGIVYRSAKTGQRCCVLFVDNDRCIDGRLGEPAVTADLELYLFGIE